MTVRLLWCFAYHEDDDDDDEDNNNNDNNFIAYLT